MRRRHTKAMLAMMAVLGAFLLVEDAMIVVREKDALMRQTAMNAAHELEILGAASEDALLRHDYITVKHFLGDLVFEHEETAWVKAVAPNGFVLVDLSKDPRPLETFDVSHTVMHKGRKLLLLKMGVDLSGQKRSLNELYRRLFAGSAAFMALLGFVLWFTQKRIAIRPLEREISMRQKAEAELVRARDELEDRVEERTEDLQRANVQLEEEVEERRNTEEALRESEHSYRTLAENLPGIVYRLPLGEEGRMRFFNDNVLPVTGYSLEELKKGEICSIENMMLPEDRPAVIKSVKDAVDRGAPFQVEYRIRRKDGEVRHLHERGVPVRGADGRPSHVDGVILDITDRKVAEEGLRKMVSTLDTLVEHIPEGVMLLGRDNRVDFVNRIGLEYLRTLTGLGEGDVLDEISGRAIDGFLVSPPHIMWHEVETAAPERRVFELAGRHVREGGEPAGMVLVVKDVTEEREIERRMGSQDRLAAVGQLASGIAHDFNNVLTGVIGYAEMLLTDSDLSAHARQQAAAILQSGQRAADLISQILDFSRRSSSEFKAVELGALLEDFVRFIARLIPENIKIIVEAEPGDHWVRADHTKLQQVLANLAVNARDAMPAGGRLVFSLSRPSWPEGDLPPFPEMSGREWVELGVSDTGSGIPQDTLPHIFEPFFTTKGMGKGTGLGLSQVYGIVKQHMGFIDVRTEFGAGAGSGTTFAIYLPVAEERTDKLALKGQEEMPRGKGEKVLVVEDEKVVRELIGRMLEGLGYSVVTASDGEEALRLVEDGRSGISVCITDVVMPGMDGIELSRRIRKADPSIRVVAVSGYPLGMEIKDLEEAGVSDWVQKPFQARSLAEVVRRVLDMPRPA